MNDLVSVIVPVYNVEKYLSKCLDSILAQTYENMEIILVDDGSTDKSGRICDKYDKAEERIRVIHKNNGGLSDARNAGLEVFKGKYVTFIDSDDWVEPTFVEYLYQLISDNDADVSVCDFNYVDDSNTLINSPATDGNVMIWTQKEAITFLLLGKKMETSSTGKMYKSEFFSELKFRFPYGRIFEDIPVVYDILLNSETICFGNKALYNYYYRQGSISTMTFSPQRLQSVEHLLESIKKVDRVYPELKREEKIAIFRMNFGIIPSFDLSVENKKYRDLVWKDIRRTRKYVIMSNKSTFNWKLKALTTYLGQTFVKRIYRKK